jgi:hypothetical protein
MTLQTEVASFISSLAKVYRASPKYPRRLPPATWLSS